MTIFLLPKTTSRAKLAAMEPSAMRPPLGRRIALELAPTRPLTWIGPGWAAICGAVASGGLSLSTETFLRIAVAVILADPVMGAWRAAWVNAEWREARRMPTSSNLRPAIVPFAPPSSSPDRLSRWLSSSTRTWAEQVWPRFERSISSLVISGFVALAMALVLGMPAFFITLLALLLAPLEAEFGRNEIGQWARALTEISAAWLVGAAAFSAPSPASILLALLFAGVYRGLLATFAVRDVGFALSNIFQLLVVAVLAVSGSLFFAAFVALAIIGQVLWQAFARWQGGDPGYLLRVQPFVLAVMLAASLGVAH